MNTEVGTPKPKALLIMPEGPYVEYIKTSMARYFDVSFFSDRPSVSFLSKLLLRVWKPLDLHDVLPYEKKILNFVRGKEFAFILVIGGECFQSSFFKKMRKAQPDARMVYYLWDTLKFYPYRAKNAPFFDKVYSFDPVDCLNKGWSYLPLFFTPAFSQSASPEIFDYCFITTGKPGKIDAFKEIQKELESHGYTKGMVFVYIQGKLVYRYFRLKYREFRKVPFSFFKTKKIPYLKTAEYIKNSRFIIDCATKGQNGLTMRTFEALGAGKKLITTNAQIKQHDFYNPTNIHVLGEAYNSSFWEARYLEPKEPITKYSLDEWVRTLITLR